MADFLHPRGVVLTKAEQSAIIVMAELMGVSQSIVYDGMQYAALAHRYKELMMGADEQEFSSRGADEQLERLARFIIASVPGEPRESEGAGDCAIRIIRELQGSNKELLLKHDELLKENRALREGEDLREEPPL